MSEKMLVTQALDERDLLVKKIGDKIVKASFVDTIKPNEDKVFAKRIDKTEYAKEAESAYQQIKDLIERFQKIDAAIVESNAKTEVKTSYGEFTATWANSEYTFNVASAHTLDVVVYNDDDECYIKIGGSTVVAFEHEY